MAVPIIRQPGLELEPLAGEAVVVGRRAGDRMNGAEGRVMRPPDDRARGIRHHHRPAEMVGMHPEQAGVRLVHAAIEHRDRQIVEPDVFAERVPRRVELGDDPVRVVVNMAHGSGLWTLSLLQLATESKICVSPPRI